MSDHKYSTFNVFAVDCFQLPLGDGAEYYIEGLWKGRWEPVNYLITTKHAAKSIAAHKLEGKGLLIVSEECKDPKNNERYRLGSHINDESATIVRTLSVDEMNTLASDVLTALKGKK